MRDGRGYWPRGKTLGGSSAINAMIYIRGNRRDFDGWREQGNRGWDWDSVLPYFRKSEDNRVEHVAADRKNHGTGGLLKVDTYGSVDPMKLIMRSALAELGLAEIFDANGDEHLGYFDAQGTLDNGARCSAAKAFLRPAKDRANLHVIKNAHATKLTWAQADDGSQVQGVQFQVDGKTLEARVSKEVIVSAGAINTPQLLQLSGIGPRDLLDLHRIPVLHDLPVGQHLQDHLIVLYGTTFHKSTAMPITPLELSHATYQYAMHRNGPLSNIGATDFVAFVSTVNDPKYPDIQYHVFHCRKQQPELRQLVHTFGFGADIVEAFGRANDEADIVIWVVVLLNPKSTGSVQLNSADPLSPPSIQHNYLQDPADLRVAVDGVKILRKMAQTHAFRAAEGEVVRVPLPACDALDYDSDAYWGCYSRYMSSTLFHPTGTARMGPDARTAVVDDALRVRGVRNLRVVDASVMPEIVSGNTNAPTIMIAEKAADMVKERWGAEGVDGRDEL